MFVCDHVYRQARGARRPWTGGCHRVFWDDDTLVWSEGEGAESGAAELGRKLPHARVALPGKLVHQHLHVLFELVK